MNRTRNISLNVKCESTISTFTGRYAVPPHIMCILRVRFWAAVGNELCLTAASPMRRAAPRRIVLALIGTPPETTMGRFQQGVANELKLVATPLEAAYLYENSHRGRLAWRLIRKR
jgi:hypothetical protein